MRGPRSSFFSFRADAQKRMKSGDSAPQRRDRHLISADRHLRQPTRKEQTRIDGRPEMCADGGEPEPTYCDASVEHNTRVFTSIPQCRVCSVAERRRMWFIMIIIHNIRSKLGETNGKRPWKKVFVTEIQGEIVVTEFEETSQNRDYTFGLAATN